jgi:hypothetical protein
MLTLQVLFFCHPAGVPLCEVLGERGVSVTANTRKVPVTVALVHVDQPRLRDSHTWFSMGYFRGVIESDELGHFVIQEGISQRIKRGKMQSRMGLDMYRNADLGFVRPRVPRLAVDGCFQGPPPVLNPGSRHIEGAIWRRAGS